MHYSQIQKSAHILFTTKSPCTIKSRPISYCSKPGMLTPKNYNTEKVPQVFLRDLRSARRGRCMPFGMRLAPTEAAAETDSALDL